MLNYKANILLEVLRCCSVFLILLFCIFQSTYFHFLSMCMCVYGLEAYVGALWGWRHWIPPHTPELELQAVMSCLTGCWEPHLDPLQEQSIFLTPKPFLQSPIHVTVDSDNSSIFSAIPLCLVRMPLQFAHSVEGWIILSFLLTMKSVAVHITVHIH